MLFLLWREPRIATTKIYYAFTEILHSTEKAARQQNFMENKYTLASHATQFSSAKRHSHVLCFTSPYETGDGDSFYCSYGVNIKLWNGSSHQTFYLVELKEAHRRYCRNCIKRTCKTSTCIGSENGTKLIILVPP